VNPLLIFGQGGKDRFLNINLIWSDHYSHSDYLLRSRTRPLQRSPSPQFSAAPRGWYHTKSNFNFFLVRVLASLKSLFVQTPCSGTCGQLSNHHGRTLSIPGCTMSVRTARNQGLLPLEGLSGLSLCLNTPRSKNGRLDRRLICRSLNSLGHRPGHIRR